MKSMFKLKHLPAILVCALALVTCSPISAQILLNREDDCSLLVNAKQAQCGVNLDVQANDNQGSAAVDLEVGLLLASTANGTGTTATGQPRGYAGQNHGGGTVRSSFTFINDGGGYTSGGSSTWDPLPQNQPDQPFFIDPTKDRAQPPTPPPAGWPGWGSGNVPVARTYFGKIPGSSDPANPTPLLPGVYYMVEPDGTGGNVATGRPLRLNAGDYYRFDPGPRNNFGEWVIVGGLDAQGGNVHIEIGPGRYIFAGALERNNRPGELLSLSSNTTITDLGPEGAQPSNAGEIFIYTDGKYPGLYSIAALVDALYDNRLTDLLSGVLGPQLKQGITGFPAGNNDGVTINLHGLAPPGTPGALDVPASLDQHRAILAWQDRNNSIVDYTDEDGFLNGHIACGNTAPGCSNTGDDRTNVDTGVNMGPEAQGDRLNSSFTDGESTEMVHPTASDVHFWGVFYQPRGAFLSVVGNGGLSAPLSIITGAMRIHQNSSLKIAFP